MSYSLSKYRPYYSSLLRIGIPILIGQLGVVVTGFLDTIMVGRYSTEALASASFVSNIFNLVNVTSLGFAYGLTPLIATAFGKGDYTAIGRWLRNGILLNMFFSLVATVVMLGFYFAIEHLGQPEELYSLIKPYFITILLSMIPMIYVSAIKQFTDGITDTRVAMWVLIGGNALNVLGNWLLIYGNWGLPELGLTGAGISTLISRILMAVAITLVILRRRRYSRYVEAFHSARIEAKCLRQILSTSFPIAIQMGLETASFTVSVIMVGWIGTQALAASQVMLVIGSLGFMIYYGIAAATSIKIANYNGADDRRALRRCSFAGYHLVLASAAVACALFWLFCKPIIGLFTADPAVVAIAVTLVGPLVLYQFGDATQAAYSNAMRGIAAVKPVMRISAIAYVVIGLPVTYLFAFPFGWGVVGIFLSFSVPLMIAGGLFIHRFYTHPAVRKQNLNSLRG